VCGKVHVLLEGLSAKGKAILVTYHFEVQKQNKNCHGEYTKAIACI